MKIIRVFILLGIFGFALHFLSCAVPVTKDIKEQTRYFEQITGRKVTSSFYFANLKGNTIGLCVYGLNRIYLDRKYWKGASHSEKLSLVLHELGHCECLSGHDEERFEFCPKSLMYPSTTSSWCHQLNWSHYIKDLKEKCK